MFFSRLRASDRWLVGKLFAVFLVILGAKFLVMSLYSSPLPFFDQWQGEGKTLLLPWLEIRLVWTDFFTPHNEHRILWTRLLVLGLFTLNQQWDAQVEMIAAAGVHALCAVVLGWIVIRRLAARWETPMLVALVLLFALPFDWEDTLSGGFQSVFYFLILFSIVAIWGLGSHALFSLRWWVGLAAAICALFSLGSGPLTAAAIAGWMTCRLLARSGSVRANGVTLIVCLVVAVAGLNWRPLGQAPGSNEPQSVGAFLTVFSGLLSWPLQSPLCGILLYAPLLFVVWRFLKTRQSNPALEFLVPLGFWVVLQAAALAYVRNRHGDPLAISRYMVFLAPGLLVNLGCLALRTPNEAATQTTKRRWLMPAVVVSVGFVVLNLARLTRESVHTQLPNLQANNARQRENIAAFLASGGNAKVFEGKTVHDLQTDYVPELMALLRNPAIRRILPAAVQTPLILAADQNQLFELVARKPTTPGEIVEPAWTAQPAPGQSAIFQSKEISTDLPYVELSTTGQIGTENTLLALVGGGQHVPLPPGRREPGTNWFRVLCRVPSATFHLKAVCRAGSGGEGFAFTFPRPVGRLSAWSKMLLERDVEVLFAGLALWAALSWLQGARRPAPAQIRGSL